MGFGIETDLHVPPFEDGGKNRAQAEAGHLIERIQ